MARKSLSKRDLASIRETAHKIHQMTRPQQLSHFSEYISELAPSDFSAIGHFSLTREDTPGLGASTYDEEFCTHYMRHGLLFDPAVRLLMTVSNGLSLSNDDPSPPDAPSIIGLKRDAGIKTCLSMAIRGQENPSLYIAFSNFNPRDQKRLSDIMLLLGPHIYQTYMRVCGKNRQSSTSQVILTIREHEIMKWVQEGKSNWDISVILGVSLNTVKFHLKNIMGKYNVENRTAALANWQASTTHLLVPSSVTVTKSKKTLPIEPPSRDQ